jgi:hypothetical protein
MKNQFPVHQAHPDLLVPLDLLVTLVLKEKQALQVIII